MNNSVVRGLIERRLPGYNNQISLEFIDDEQGQDVFEIDGVEGAIILRGNNPISLAKALHEYVKYEVNCHFSWCGNQLNLPKWLPAPRNNKRQVIPQKYRVYFNYCTINYTASWWDFERWEEEIDFMALNGINMPLSIVGIEGVWYEALMKFGLTDEEARDFLVGPAFFAWQWMTNIQSHGGPLPKSWIEKHVVLGRKILERQLEWGMKPIQQGFSGYVPKLFKAKFPNANIKIESEWCAFEGTAQLDPLDPLFKQFGKVFLETQRELFGAHHFYAADPFHEGEPPVDTPEYLGQVGEAIKQLFNEFDPQATWVMQAWSIRKPIVEVIPKDRLIILDLDGGRSRGCDYFWGYPFVTGNLHNFGGRINLHGDLKLLANNAYKQMKQEAENLCGTGLFMESIVQNPAYYDLAFEQLTSSQVVDLPTWLKGYSHRRYGTVTPQAEEAWRLLSETAYRPGTNGVENSSMICARPAVEVKKSGPNAGFHIPYDNKLLYKSLNLLLEVYDVYQESEAYLYDVVDLSRQVLSNYTQVLHQQLKTAYYAHDLQGVREIRARFIGVLEDVDRLLRLRPEFSYEKWVKDARSWGDTEEEKALYEWNATVLVTIWGPINNPIIFDYSWREWSGLIGGYYKGRWNKFYDYIEEVIVNNEVYTEEGLPLVHGRETFRANGFYNELANWEMQWIREPKVFASQSPVKDYTQVKATMDRYREAIGE